MTTEERIQKEAEEYAGSKWPVLSPGIVEKLINVYIAVATSEAARNKENAIAFQKWAYVNGWVYYDKYFDYWKKNDTHMHSEKLYDLYIEQNKKV